MKNKKIYDPIHKYMEFEPLLLQIIDTPEFQRLRNIKQLGLCYYVFSGASHNRFEHSLGVAHLSGVLLKHLQNNQPELSISNRDILLVKIAGLIHDIGHCCFSHFFDNYFIKDKFSNCENMRHEVRSQMIFTHIVEKYKLDLTKEEVKKINSLIDPDDSNIDFIYQIIANNKSGIDCDKFDYLLRDTYCLGLPYSFECNRFIENTRVIDNIICYSDKLLYDIYDLFNLRFRLHKQIYNHHTINQIEHMILDIFNLVDKDFNISKTIFNIEKFITLTDNILEEIFYSTIKNENIIKAKKIIKQIRLRQLYKLEEEILVDSTNIPKKILEKYNNFKDDNYCYSFNIINYTKGLDNPMNYIYLYNNNNNKFLLDLNKIKVYPSQFQEIIFRVFKKN